MWKLLHLGPFQPGPEGISPISESLYYVAKIWNIHLGPKKGEAVVSRAQRVCRWFLEDHAPVGIMWMLPNQGHPPLYRPPCLLHPLIWTCTGALGSAVCTVSPCSSTINGKLLKSVSSQPSESMRGFTGAQFKAETGLCVLEPFHGPSAA